MRPIKSLTINGTKIDNKTTWKGISTNDKPLKFSLESEAYSCYRSGEYPRILVMKLLTTHKGFTIEIEFSQHRKFKKEYRENPEYWEYEDLLDKNELVSLHDYMMYKKQL